GPLEQSSNASINHRLQQAQAEVEEVVGVIHLNVDKVLERDQKLSELDDQADALQLKRKYWWKNYEVMICAIVVVVICK
uniref:V-SNARE coiled-coil homology domain-containing protein n=1 Tax=Apteryx owenii TaxID=8824 RepID=A0A8B9PM61_APTOW